VPNDPAGDVPDCVLLPTQLGRAAPLLTCERRLALGVLSLAIADLRGCGVVSSNGHRGPAAVAAWRRRMAREARTWIDAEDGAWPYSFVNLCSVLGLDPDAVRAALADRRAA